MGGGCGDSHGGGRRGGDGSASASASASNGAIAVGFDAYAQQIQIQPTLDKNPAIYDFLTFILLLKRYLNLCVDCNYHMILNLFPLVIFRFKS